MRAFALIEAEKAHFPVSFMCSRLGVSTSGYYAWRHRPPSTRALADAELTERITAIHTDSRGTYGAPRIHAELRMDHGVACGRKRIARLMRTAGLEGVHRRRRQGLTRRDPNGEVSDDLVERNFRPTAPDRLWVADITQQRCWDGWLYVAVVIDAFSRRVVGWSMAEHLRTELVLDALNMAVAHRRPTVQVVHHSDHGCQYTSLAFGRRLREARLARSMGSVGDCFDNAVAESFFATLKKELVRNRAFDSRESARAEVFEYIEVFYNRQRAHSLLSYETPRCI